jgi:hypothetical protein
MIVGLMFEGCRKYTKNLGDDKLQQGGWAFSDFHERLMS